MRIIIYNKFCHLIFFFVIYNLSNIEIYEIRFSHFYEHNGYPDDHLMIEISDKIDISNYSNVVALVKCQLYNNRKSLY